MAKPICPPPRGDCDYVASILRDLRRDTPGLGPDREDSESAAIDRVQEYLSELAKDRKI